MSSPIVSCAYPALPPPVGVRLTVMPEHTCPYLPDRTAQYRALRLDQLPGSLYHRFMDANFRRSGTILYQPVCPGCRACIQLRVLVGQFNAGKTHRRCMRRNSDLTITYARPALTQEKFDLYRRYTTGWHEQTPDASDFDDLKRFLYDSPVDTIEFTYRDTTGRLLGVGICDVCDQSLSSVYFYFDPLESHRSLGTLGVLRELEWAQNRSIPFYYLGYWVDGSRTMVYKTSYRPLELLGPDGEWRPAP